MTAFQKCAVCGKTFENHCHFLIDRENLTCGPECRRAQRTIMQRKRRLEARMVRLKKKAAKNGRQGLLALKARTMARSRLQRVARRRWAAAKAKGRK